MNPPTHPVQPCANTRRADGERRPPPNQHLAPEHGHRGSDQLLKAVRNPGPGALGAELDLDVEPAGVVGMGSDQHPLAAPERLPELEQGDRLEGLCGEPEHHQARRFEVAPLPDDLLPGTRTGLLQTAGTTRIGHSEPRAVQEVDSCGLYQGGTAG